MSVIEVKRFYLNEDFEMVDEPEALFIRIVTIYNDAPPMTQYAFVNKESKE